MRIDARANPERRFYEVTVDGLLLQDCVMADDELGIAEAFVVDLHGNLFPNDSERGFETHVFHGRVGIRETDRARPWGGDRRRIEGPSLPCLLPLPGERPSLR